MDGAADLPHIGEDAVASAVVEGVFVAAVERGDVLIDGRPVAEIITDFRKQMIDRITTQKDDTTKEVLFAFSADYRSNLLAQASRHSSSAEYETSLILYATWIEHELNATISRAFERNNISDESTRALLRSVNLDTKMTALWEVAGVPKINADLLQTIKLIASLRNEFVHYKWPSEPNETQVDSSKDRYYKAVQKCPVACSELQRLTEGFFWSGRRDEIMEALRAGGLRHP